MARAAFGAFASRAGSLYSAADPGDL